MTTFTVTDQHQLDAALTKAGRYDEIVINSPRGVWIEVGGSSGAYGSASVRAYGSASVRASGSASVSAYGSASVRAYGSASVSAYGSASVRAYGSASVSAYDSASVRAYGSASVSAYDSASVSAYDSASVTAGSHTAVHLHSKRVTVEGGVIIDVTDLNLTDPKTWCAYTGAKIDKRKVSRVEDGKKRSSTVEFVTLYKAVNDDLKSGYNFPYPIGETVTAPDWRDTDECGHGLHFGPTPAHALAYNDTATRFLAVEVPLSGLRPITGSGTAKAKAESAEVLFEVDVHGRKIETPSAVSA